MDIVLSSGYLAFAAQTGFLFSVAQIPPPLFSEDFEADNGGFTPTGDWQWDQPDSSNGVDLDVLAGNGGAGKCWGTNLGLSDEGFITPAADSILRGPDATGSGIDLTGISAAELRFAAAVDAKAGDTLEVLVKEVGSNDPLVTITPITDFTPPVTKEWTSLGPFDISAASN